ncbi:MAG: ATP-binding protein [Tardiphaga sp.]|nr:ATP-binding protein [Tardiphaga sp.]
MTSELQALQKADFGWVRSLDSVWSDEATDAGPNEHAVEAVIAELAGLTRSPNPPGRAFLGQAGIGKTHLVSVLRHRAWEENGWFIMLDVVGINDFWKSAALSFLTSLLQQMPNGQRQHEAVISGVARRFKIEKEVNFVFENKTVDPKLVVDLLVKGLLKSDPANALNHQDVFRALALLRSHDLASVGIAHAWLQGYEADEAIRKSLGFLKPPPSPVEIVRGLMWIMALAGPTLIAVDQIDGVLSAGGSGSDLGDTPNFTKLLTGGLLDLARVIDRGMLVITCLLSSWEIIKRDGPGPLHQSFSAPTALRPMQQEVAVRKLLVDRLAPAYAEAGIEPSSATWPFSDAAIRSAAIGLTPRTILMRCDAHRKQCLELGRVVPCDSLGEDPTRVHPARPAAGDSYGAAFSDAAAAADIDELLDDKNDGKLGMLLRDAFDLYVKQIPPHDDYDVVAKTDPGQKTPPLHGRLTFIDHRANDSERHFCFRALQHSNAVALCARFRAALTASGIAANVPHRHLIVVRRGPPPSGKKTGELFEAFGSAGGLQLDPSDADLRTFVALVQMRDDAIASGAFDAFQRWLIDRKPLCETAFFKAAGLCPPPLPTVDEPTGGITSAETMNESPSSPAALIQGLATPKPPVSARIAVDSLALSTIPIGRRAAGGDDVALAIALLPRHTAIIAGAGSGKTVLLRRLVEEAAPAGIPAIVIDPNNDLARLGDAWPQRPLNFTDEDAVKAQRYAQVVEVVVWTPGISAGNPLFLSVLPDFTAIGDDPDELSQAVTMAADTLGPLAGAKTNLQKGVLNDALRAFAIQGGSDLKTMTALLADLPDGVSEIGQADKLAAKMADELKAAVATNPLLKASGPVLDPKLLFFGASPSKTRISVINLSGLASDEAKQDFVNRLQMTLFGWIKKNPSPRGLLYVIDEAQSFVPSGAGALSKTSGVQLVAQARKYGLGMIVVTQAPKGIDNKVISNCTTQFLGKQNSPTDQQSVKSMIAATGGTADDVGKLAAGEFYFKTEKSGKPFKLMTPICLSFHPPNPPTPEEVVARAKKSAARI